jgi:ketosteroid isomerase-like protein
MSGEGESGAAGDVTRVVTAINQVWRVAEPDEIAPLLQPYFAEEMTIAGPGLLPVGAGRELAIGSYADFARMAKISSFEMDLPVVHVAGDTAVATYGWRIRYSLEGADFDETGHDVFVLRRTAAGWLATWRAMLPD